MPAIGPYAFSNPFILAPMAGVSEMPFRVLALEHGAALAPTELVSAKGLQYQNRRTRQYLEHSAVETPFCVQLFGGDIASMTVAAERAVEAGAQMLDINMGCPVRKVTKTGAGSALMCDPQRAGQLVRAMTQVVGDKVPITAKMRSGWDQQSISCVELALRLEDAGAAAVALHARTRSQGYSGKADWSLIAQLKAALRIPVIGNGDVVTATDARRMQLQTGCDFVMVGRGALGNPWVFESMVAGVDRPAPGPARRLQLITRHLKEHVAFVGDELRAIRQFRQHLIWYSKGLRGGAAFREQVTRLDDMNAVWDLCGAFFEQATHSGEATTVDDGVNYQAALG